MKSVGNIIENYGEVSKNYKSLIENVKECIWLFDLKNMCFKYVSPSVMDLCGLTVEEAMNEKLEDLLTEESLQKMLHIINERKITSFLNGNISEDNVYDIDVFQQYYKDGTIKNVEISTKLIFNEKTKYVDILGVSRNIEQRKIYSLNLRKEIDNKDALIKRLMESEKRYAELLDVLVKKNRALKKIAITDELTGTHNRYYFNKKIKEIIGYENYKNLTLIIIDVDRFKHVNDSLGHDTGDKVLRKIVSKSIKLIRKSDIFARWGGDEFIILSKQTSLHDGKILAENLCRELRETYHPTIGQVTASFGVAEKQKFESFESWFKRADVALYNAKNKGGNCVGIK